MLHNNDNTEPNGTDKSAPSNTITGEHTNQIGALQAIVACDTNVALLREINFWCFPAKSQNFVPV